MTGYPCCCVSGFDPCTLDGTDCPASFQIDFAGFAVEDPVSCVEADCLRLNDSFIVTQVQDTSCLWRYVDPTGWCGLANTIQLTFTVGRVGLVLITNPLIRAQFTRTYTNPFDCTALNVDDFTKTGPQSIGCSDFSGPQTCKVTSL